MNAFVFADPETPGDLPQWQALKDPEDRSLSFRQVLPFNEPVGGKPGEPHPKDRAFRLSAFVNVPWEPERVNTEGILQGMAQLERLVTEEP